ncbi:MAG: hypothetical protein GW903_02390 [Alphaproteobacteria bacterium]|nr:hypothetical protein [Alphaproteobacteria bacterium]NCQ87821.1 hypothetical protein [Alphaproteobacteria bacterium]NCT05671.1 hypothetical protein [Alphaproteobacteria bacterium]
MIKIVGFFWLFVVVIAVAGFIWLGLMDVSVEVQNVVIDIPTETVLK